MLIPGYGMNDAVFRYHPGGVSFVEALANAGLQPWTLDPRGTRSSRAPSRRSRVRLEDQAFIDLPAAMDRVAALSGHERVHAIGCSLGGALLYAYVGAMAHRVDRLVAMGSPLTWTDRGGILRLFGALGPAVSRVPIRGVSALARAGLPLLRHLPPSVTGFYVNPQLTDLRDARQVARIVESPHADVSLRLSQWIRDGDLTLGGHDVRAGLRQFERPLLLVLATGDGVCPPAAAKPALTAVGGPATLLEVDHPLHRVSHADLFLGAHVSEAVFQPIASWLSPAGSQTR